MGVGGRLGGAMNAMAEEGAPGAVKNSFRGGGWEGCREVGEWGETGGGSGGWLGDGGDVGGYGGDVGGYGGEHGGRKGEGGLAGGAGGGSGDAGGGGSGRISGRGLRRASILSASSPRK